MRRSQVTASRRPHPTTPQATGKHMHGLAATTVVLLPVYVPTKEALEVTPECHRFGLCAPLLAMAPNILRCFSVNGLPRILPSLRIFRALARETLCAMTPPYQLAPQPASQEASDEARGPAC
jgi:hypothetical protein